MFSTSPSSCFMLPASLKTKLALSTRGGILKVVTPGGECAWFDAQTCCTTSLTYPSQPSSFRSCASPHLLLKLKDESTIRPMSRGDCFSLWAESRTTSSVAYVLDVRRRVRSCLPRFTIRSRRALKCNGFSLMFPVMTALRLL